MSEGCVEKSHRSQCFGSKRSAKGSLGRLRAERSFAPCPLYRSVKSMSDAAQLEREALDLIREGDLEGARDALTMLLQKRPDDRKLRQRIAQIDAHLAKRGEVERKVRDEPERFAKAYIMAGRWGEALQLLRQDMTLDPKNERLRDLALSLARRIRAQQASSTDSQPERAAAPLTPSASSKSRAASRRGTSGLPPSAAGPDAEPSAGPQPARPEASPSGHRNRPAPTEHPSRSLGSPEAPARIHRPADSVSDSNLRSGPGSESRPADVSTRAPSRARIIEMSVRVPPAERRRRRLEGLLCRIRERRRDSA